MPPITRSGGPAGKRVTIILQTSRPRPRFMKKLPPEIRTMIYKLLLPGPRTIEVVFAALSQASDQSATVAENTDISVNLLQDDDPTDLDFKKTKSKSSKPPPYKFVNTNTENRLVLHQINQETRHFVLAQGYNVIFKTPTSPGTLFNFQQDILAFTSALDSTAEQRFRFIDKKSFQFDIARIQNLAYLFSFFYRELQRVHFNQPRARVLMTRFANLKKVIIPLPVAHLQMCEYCQSQGQGGQGSVIPSNSMAAGVIQTAQNNFDELKQKLIDRGIVWQAPTSVYITHCMRQRWNLDLGDHEPDESS
ncbi:uncharacterized protein L3040_007982 [Drepanopeziza brunnea f. sp. 'multigermtubi']|uniref:uncharacterized protein n=1 Tax=Drepanopeziza brunnea f. sp. 'multigermtubi' TaxID=698441 RepID=UPI00238A3B96|nr:hypothetical protein L3040_007982 [Drepanopeziza brunnea f. sp. 'multigermtubi']